MIAPLPVAPRSVEDGNVGVELQLSLDIVVEYRVEVAHCLREGGTICLTARQFVDPCDPIGMPVTVMDPLGESSVRQGLAVLPCLFHMEDSLPILVGHD